MARPTKLDEGTAHTLLDALRVGCPIRVACRAAGVGVTTFKTWMTRGNSEADEDAPYRTFRADVKKARASGEAAALKIIHEAMPSTWQAAAWFLERSWPERWGKLDPARARLIREVGIALPHADVRRLTDEELTTVLAIFRRTKFMSPGTEGSNQLPPPDVTARMLLTGPVEGDH